MHLNKYDCYEGLTVLWSWSKARTYEYNLNVKMEVKIRPLRFNERERFEFILTFGRSQLTTNRCSNSATGPRPYKPGQTDSQVNASLQNQNLRTDLRRVAKRIRKSQKVVNFAHIIG